MVSLVVSTYYSTYFNSIGLLAWRKITGNAPAQGPWSIGKRASLAVNLMALVYIVIVFIFSFFPLAIPVDVVSMNWAVVLYFGVLFLGVAVYLVRGNKFVEPKPIYRKN